MNHSPILMSTTYYAQEDLDFVIDQSNIEESQNEWYQLVKGEKNRYPYPNTSCCQWVENHGAIVQACKLLYFNIHCTKYRGRKIIYDVLECNSRSNQYSNTAYLKKITQYDSHGFKGTLSQNQDVLHPVKALEFHARYNYGLCVTMHACMRKSTTLVVECIELKLESWISHSVPYFKFRFMCMLVTVTSLLQVVDFLMHGLTHSCNIL